MVTRLKNMIDFEQKSEKKQVILLVLLCLLESVLVTLTLIFFRYYRSYSSSWSRATYARPYQIRFVILLPLTVLLGLYFARCLSGFLKRHPLRESIRLLRIDRIKTEFIAPVLLWSFCGWTGTTWPPGSMWARAPC